MLLYIFLAVAAIILLFVIVVAARPADFRIVRSASMTATPADVFTEVNDLRRWDAWSPWARLDPNMKQEYEGPPTGVGATHSWNGNSKVGEGRMTITTSRPNELVRLKLDFLRPFKATHTAEFTFMPHGQNTDVTWTMIGQNNFISKAFCMFVNMDKMVGRDFERGLASLKAIVEKR